LAARVRLTAAVGQDLVDARRGPGFGGGVPVEHALFSLEGSQAATTRLLRHGVTEPELVVRGSTGPVPAAPASAVPAP
jgi:hypothetical protein